MEFLISAGISIAAALVGFSFALQSAKSSSGKDACTWYDSWDSNAEKSLYGLFLGKFPIPGLIINGLTTIMSLVMGLGFVELVSSLFGAPGFLDFFLVAWFFLTYGVQWFWYKHLFSGNLNGSKMIGWSLVGLFGAMSAVSFFNTKILAGILFLAHAGVSAYLGYYYSNLASKNPGK